MAVYFAPRQERPIWADLAVALGSGLIGNMFNRDARANEYKYAAKLEADKRAAKQSIAQSLGENFAGMGYNPNVGLAMGNLQQLGASLKDAQPYILPQTETVNAGDRIVNRKVNPYNNETVGDEYSVDVKMNPYQEAQNVLNNDRFSFDKQQAAFSNDLENRKLAQLGAYQRGQLAIAGREKERPSDLIPDGNGGYVFVNRYTKEIAPTDIKAPPQRVDPQAAMAIAKLIDTLTADNSMTGGNKGMTQDEAMSFIYETGLLPKPQATKVVDPKVQAFMNKTGMTEAEAIEYIKKHSAPNK